MSTKFDKKLFKITKMAMEKIGDELHKSTFPKKVAVIKPNRAKPWAFRYFLKLYFLWSTSSV
jgi:hypothetical protein